MNPMSNPPDSLAQAVEDYDVYSRQSSPLVELWGIIYDVEDELRPILAYQAKFYVLYRSPAWN